MRVVIATVIWKREHMARKTISTLSTALVVAVVAATAYAASGPLLLGPAAQTQQLTYKGYYDGHLDSYLITDVSSKAQATALHVNYSAALATVHGAPAQYFVRGKAASGQLTVFGSQPGETDYNPLWEELFVTWKPGVKVVLLVRDDQIKALVKANKLALSDAHIVLNAPITKVGK
jgi:hypothetical protein